MRKVDLLARDVFPGWMRTGPWPYEVGMVCLMVWIVWCLLHGGVLRLVPGLPLTPFSVGVSGSYPIHAVIVGGAILLIAGMLTGLGMRLAGNQVTANRVRGVSILGASIYAGALSVLFTVAVDYSLAGGAYAFIAWRAFCVGVRLWWEPTNAQPPG